MKTWTIDRMESYLMEGVALAQYKIALREFRSRLPTNPSEADVIAAGREACQVVVGLLSHENQ